MCSKANLLEISTIVWVCCRYWIHIVLRMHSMVAMHVLEEQHREHQMARNHCGHIIYPNHLAPLSEFLAWLQSTMWLQMALDEIVCETICALAFPRKKRHCRTRVALHMTTPTRSQLTTLWRGSLLLTAKFHWCHSNQGDMNMVEGGCYMLELFKKLCTLCIQTTPQWSLAPHVCRQMWEEIQTSSAMHMGFGWLIQVEATSRWPIIRLSGTQPACGLRGWSNRAWLEGGVAK